MTDDTHDPERPKRLAKSATALSEFFGQRQRIHAQKAQDFGYAKEAFRVVAKNLEQTPDDPLLAAPEESFEKFRVLVETREADADRYHFDVSSMSFAIATTTTATVGAISGIDLESWIATVVSPDPPPHWSSERRTQFANRLDQLDPELGRLARSVWQSFYGGADNAERASLLSMRQLYDHLFSLLAPDDKVRNSPFFTTKGGDKPSQVHRKERLHYAAATHVRDAPLRETLLSQVDHVIQVYDRLNELHARKPLERRRAQDLIMAMEEVLHEWLSATSAA